MKLALEEKLQTQLRKQEQEARLNNLLAEN